MRVGLIVFVLSCVLATGSLGQANLSLIWAEWETSAPPKQGPEHADGLLLYFHGRGGTWGDQPKTRILPILEEMAKVANWDVLRINRHAFADTERSDDDILQFVAERVARARQDGYKKIVVGGGSGGGWLALLAAAVPGVDAAIGFAPGTAYGRSELIRTRDVLAERLARAKATRIAVFFFEGDLLENLEVRRSVAIRRGLVASGASFAIIDHPPDLYGHPAMVSGRLVRRYRDCLLRLVRDADLPAGEIQCSLSTGYAAGSDIGFPASVGSVELAPNADAMLLPYVGRWEGDDEWGAYLIFETTVVGQSDIVFKVGCSELGPRRHEAWTGSYSFRLNKADGSIFFTPDTGRGVTIARLRSTAELELELLEPHLNGQEIRRRTLLYRRGRN
jgi:pimeloyl-ACP methyl ester carboxylesterase